MRQPMPKLFLAFSLFLLSATMAAARPLLIRGGTLIDGTGKAPVPNANILIDGNLIRRVWTGNATSQDLPPDTQIIDGQGKYPGYNYYKVAGLAIGGKGKGEAQNENPPVDVKSLLP